MKRVYGLLVLVFIGASVMAQPTPHEKKEIKKDLVQERDKKGDVAKDLLTGKPKKAKADHKAAVAAHKRAVRKAEAVRRRDAARVRAANNR